MVTPERMTLTKRGCPLCPKKTRGYSAKAIKWLNYLSGFFNLKIKHACNGGEYKVKSEASGNSYYSFDGYNVFYNIVFEYLGDYFHGNPNTLHPGYEEQHASRYKSTIKRLRWLLSKHFHILFAWESGKCSVLVTKFPDSKLEAWAKRHNIKVFTNLNLAVAKFKLKIRLLLTPAFLLYQPL